MTVSPLSPLDAHLDAIMSTLTSRRDLPTPSRDGNTLTFATPADVRTCTTAGLFAVPDFEDTWPEEAMGTTNANAYVLDGWVPFIVAWRTLVKTIMQARCIFCLREQYAIAVWDISHGRAGCVWCGQVPPVFTEQAHYDGALKAARSEAGR